MQKRLRDSCITIAHPTMSGRNWETGKLEHTALQADQSGWRVTFPGDSVVLNLVQAAPLVFVSFRQFISASFRLPTMSTLQLGLFESDSEYSLLFTPGEGGT